MVQLYEYYNTDDDSASTVYGVYWRAQTFTVGSVQHTVTSVKLKLFRGGSPGTVTVSIKATNGNGHPTGSDLTSGTTNGNTLPTDPRYEWREITLTEYTLSANTKYAIVVRAPSGNISNYLRWRADSSDPTYTGGNFESSSDSGSSWTAYTGYDMMFEVWGSPVPTAYYVTISDSLGMLDSITKPVSFRKTVSDSLGMVDAVGKVKGMHQTVSDSLSMTDSIDKVRRLYETISESLGMLDSIPTKASFKQAIADSLGMLDSITKPVSFRKTVSDSLGMTDTIGTKASFKQAISEKLGMTDAVGTKAAFKQVISEKLGVLDSATRSRGFPIAISDILGMRDRLESRRRKGKLGDLPDDTITGGAPPS
jgi:hypothetical protein